MDTEISAFGSEDATVGSLGCMGSTLNAQDFVIKQKELHCLNSDSLCRKHTAADDRKDYTEPGPVYKKRDAI